MSLYHIADIHIQQVNHEKILRTWDDFVGVLTSADKLVIAGDIFEFKTRVHADDIMVFNKMLADLEDREVETLIVLGNHDFNSQTSVFNHIPDLVGPIMHDRKYKFITLVTETSILEWTELGGWMLQLHIYSALDMRSPRDLPVPMPVLDEIAVPRSILPIRKVAIAHEPVRGCVTDTGYTMKNGRFDVTEFKDYDITILGDIHVPQFLLPNVAYSGSFVQKNRGEGLKHGYIRWDVGTGTGEFYQLPQYFPDIRGNPDELGKIDADIVVQAKSVVVEALGTITDASRAEIMQKFNRIDNIVDTTPAASVTATDEIGFITEFLKNAPGDLDAVLSLHSEYSASIVTPVRKQWKLRYLQWKNIYKYAEHSYIDFTSVSGPCVLVGNNAVGKSSIISIITAILFGGPRSRDIPISAKLMLNNTNEANGHIMAGIEFEGDKYDIYRIYKRDERGDSFTIRKNGEIISAGDIDKSRKLLESIVGSREDFVSIPVALQSRHSILDMTNAAVCTFLLRVTGIDVLTDKHKANERRLAAVRSELKARPLRVNVDELRDNKLRFTADIESDLISIAGLESRIKPVGQAPDPVYAPQDIVTPPEVPKPTTPAWFGLGIDNVVCTRIHQCLQNKLFAIENVPTPELTQPAELLQTVADLDTMINHYRHFSTEPIVPIAESPPDLGPILLRIAKGLVSAPTRQLRECEITEPAVVRDQQVLLAEMSAICRSMMPVPYITPAGPTPSITVNQARELITRCGTHTITKTGGVGNTASYVDRTYADIIATLNVFDVNEKNLAHNESIAVKRTELIAKIAELSAMPDCTDEPVESRAELATLIAARTGRDCNESLDIRKYISDLETLKRLATSIHARHRKTHLVATFAAQTEEIVSLCNTVTAIIENSGQYPIKLYVADQLRKHDELDAFNMRKSEIAELSAQLAQLPDITIAQCKADRVYIAESRAGVLAFAQEQLRFNDAAELSKKQSEAAEAAKSANEILNVKMKQIQVELALAKQNEILAENNAILAEQAEYKAFLADLGYMRRYIGSLLYRVLALRDIISEFEKYTVDLTAYNRWSRYTAMMAAHTEYLANREAWEAANREQSEITQSLSGLRACVHAKTLKLGRFTAELEAAEELVAWRDSRVASERIFALYDSITDEKNGLLGQLLQQRLDVIEKLWNEHLSRVVNFRVKIVKSSSTIEFMIAESRGVYISSDVASGFQKFVLDITFRESIYEMANIANPNFMMIDEGFGSADETNRTALRSYLSTIGSRYDFVLMISHIEDLIVGSRLAIESTSGGSRIRIGGLPSLALDVESDAEMAKKMQAKHARVAKKQAAESTVYQKLITESRVVSAMNDPGFGDRTREYIEEREPGFYCRACKTDYKSTSNIAKHITSKLHISAVIKAEASESACSSGSSSQ